MEKKPTSETKKTEPAPAEESAELSEGQLDAVTGGADALRLLATVAHNQAESAGDDLEAMVEKASTKKPRPQRQ